MKLYKYCSTDHLENLKNNVLYFNSVGNLNDFYELLFRFDVTEDMRIPFYKHVFREAYEEKLFSRYPFEAFESQIQDSLLEERKDIGITCFSEINNSIVMWSHYADKHKGICIEYDSNKPIFNLAKDVTYSKTIYNISVKNKSELTTGYLDSEVIKQCYYKCDEWNYEKEWRILYKSNGIVKYEPDSLTAIYFGINTERADIEKIFEYTKHISGIQYYRQLFDRRNYKIEFDEVNYSMLKKV